MDSVPSFDLSKLLLGHTVLSSLAAVYSDQVPQWNIPLALYGLVTVQSAQVTSEALSTFVLLFGGSVVLDLGRLIFGGPFQFFFFLNFLLKPLTLVTALAQVRQTNDSNFLPGSGSGRGGGGIGDRILSATSGFPPFGHRQSNQSQQPQTNETVWSAPSNGTGIPGGGGGSYQTRFSLDEDEDANNQEDISKRDPEPGHMAENPLEYNSQTKSKTRSTPPPFGSTNKKSGQHQTKAAAAEGANVASPALGSMTETTPLLLHQQQAHTPSYQSSTLPNSQRSRSTNTTGGTIAPSPPHGSSSPPRRDGRVSVHHQDEVELPDDWTKLKDCNVFHMVHEIYRLFTSEIPIAITEEQMRDPNVVFHLNDVLRSELETTYNSPCIVYVLMLTRLQFLRERGAALASTSLCETRANYCEYFAVHMLRHQGRSVQGGAKMQQLAMARALVGGLHAFQGASEEVLERIRKNEGGTSRVYAQGAGKTNALELAILGKAKKFIKSDACQRVISAIYDGRITYSSSSFFDLLPDRWKTKDISLYNVRAAPLLDHYRLRVPKYRSMIDVLSFAILFVSFLHVIIDRHYREELVHMSSSEIWFFCYALGYSLDRCAAIFEHGWSVFAMGLSAPLDILSVPIYVSAFGLRVHAVSKMDPAMSDRAYAILSCAACLLFPRIAFTAISKNLFILSLRAMLAEFFYLMSVTVFCFLGFVFALNHLCDGAYSVTRISEWLIFIYFGLDGTGIDKSPKFDPVIGPILFISFAALSNTLLTAVLVAILSTTYSKIAEDADAENMFRKAVMTLEGVKSDSLFDYMPPVNLIAITFLWPLSHVLSERKFHSLNVLCTRILSLPILLVIAAYERQRVSDSSFRDIGDRIKNSLTSRLPVSLSEKMSLLEGAHWETEAVFEYTPSGDEKSDNEDEEDEVQMGADEGIEEWILEGKGPDGQRRVSSRFSSALDPNKVQEAQLRMLDQDKLHPEGGGGPRGTVRRRSSATPIPISRQASFNRNQVTSSPPSITPQNTPPATTTTTTINPEQSILRRSRPRGDSGPPPSDQAVQFAAPSRPPKRRTTRESGGERLPANASSGSGAIPSFAPPGSSPQSNHSQYVDFPQLSTSAPTRDSPFIKRYLNGEPGAVGNSSNALGRRLSLSQTSRSRAWSEAANLRAGGGTTVVDELSMAQMMRMIKGLVDTVDRLERKLQEKEGKGKAKENDHGDESAIDDDSDDGDGTP